MLERQERESSKVNNVVQITRDRKVSFLEDTKIRYPDLWLGIYLFGPSSEAAPFPEHLARAACFKADTPDEADIVLFLGGSDINPILYGKKPHLSTRFNEVRDRDDMLMYSYCLERGIPMYGICRGAQFLWVMNGGELYQDVDGHHGDHAMWDRINNRMIPRVSSVHHQQCKETPGMNEPEILGTVHGKARKRWSDNQVYREDPIPEIEAYFIRETCCLGIQGHPEYRNYHEFAEWSFKRIEHHITHNPDLDYPKEATELNPKRRLRIKPDLLAQRKLGWDITKKEAC